MSKKSKSLSMNFASTSGRDTLSSSPTSPSSPLSPNRRTLQPSTIAILSSPRQDYTTINSLDGVSPTLRPSKGSLLAHPHPTVNGIQLASQSLPSQSNAPTRGLQSSNDRPLFPFYHNPSPSNRLATEGIVQKVPEGIAQRGGNPSLGGVYMIRQASGSSPDLRQSTSTECFDGQPGRKGRESHILKRRDSSLTYLGGPKDSSGSTTTLQRRPVGTAPRFDDPSRIRTTTTTTTNTTTTATPTSKGARKHKPKPFAHLLVRSRSIRMEQNNEPSRTPDLTRSGEPEFRVHLERMQDAHGLKTAPLQGDRDRSFRDMMSSSVRHRSADRQGGSEAGSMNSQQGTSHHPPSFVSNFRENTGSGLFSNIKSSGKTAAGGFGKASKGIFGKLTRSGSSSDNTTTDENYVCQVIGLPLVHQTRRTRISKLLENSKDKTEFWMPALPWRCIDYLNDRGCEEEGLYRIPGSGPKIKHWQRRFDSELDVNLFEEPELYDINIIGSMLKAWLRELPDEILPKATQARIARECLGATEVPQMLKDELSKLPPFNYYLLFAITCHLSLLHSYVDKNKMDYRNLCICFQPCLKIDGFCFQFLVCDWKHCWQGCWTEKAAVEEEYRYLHGLPSRSSGGGGSAATGSFYAASVPPDSSDERAASSSSSSKAPSVRKASPSTRKQSPDTRKDPPARLESYVHSQPDPRSAPSGWKASPQTGAVKHRPPPLQNLGSMGVGPSPPTTRSIAPETPRAVARENDPQKKETIQQSPARQLPPLSPIVPLSPLGI